MNKKIQIIQGPNLNMLGIREPEIYGYQSLEDINQICIDQAVSLDLKIDLFQSNSESEIIECIHNCSNNVDIIIINPAAYTHTSIAIRDALQSVAIPFIEVHLSNIFSREKFRTHSFISDLALAVISGMGSYGYITAINFSKEYFDRLI